MNALDNTGAKLAQTARRHFLARQRRPFLIGDWTRALFLHFELPAEILRPHVPFELDLCNGRAFVSAVAFSMENLRPGFGGVLGRILFRPVARHNFFNLRAYVVHEGRPAIYFICEWLNNRLCVLGGPVTYGLPYRFARLQYNHRPETRRLSGRVGDQFAYEAELPPGAGFQPCPEGSLDEFLLERYTACTRRGGSSRCFDITHEPWPQTPVTARIKDDRLLLSEFSWFAESRLIGANYSPGVREVWIGPPSRLRG